MRKALLAAGLAAAMLSAPLRAGMVTARWGVKGPVQHPGTLTYEPAGAQGTLMVFDLSALPRGAEVCRARLFFSGVNWKEKGFDIVPARREGAGNDAKIEAAGPQVAPAGPLRRLRHSGPQRRLPRAVVFLLDGPAAVDVAGPLRRGGGVLSRADGQACSSGGFPFGLELLAKAARAAQHNRDGRGSHCRKAG